MQFDVILLIFLGKGCRLSGARICWDVSVQSAAQTSPPNYLTGVSSLPISDFAAATRIQGGLTLRIRLGVVQVPSIHLRRLSEAPAGWKRTTGLSNARVSTFSATSDFFPEK